MFVSSNLRKVFLIGAPRCGTTSVAALLDKHPQICFSTMKEPWYLNTDFGPRKITKLKNYHRLFKHCGNHHNVLAEASTTYFYSNAARIKIRKMEHATVLIMTRDPVEMFRSWHLLKLRTGEEDIEDPEKAWRAIEKRKKGIDIPDTCREPRWLFYDEMCMLGSWVEKWIRDLGQNRVKTLFLEDLREDSASFFKDVSEKLSIDTFSLVEEKIDTNKTTVPKWNFLDHLIRSIGSIRRKILPPYIRFGVLTKLLMWNSRITKKDYIQKLSPDFECELRLFFTPDIEKLENYTGRDLAKWKLKY